MINRFAQVSAALALGAVLCPQAAGATEPAAVVEVDEWQVPYEKTRPRDPFVDSKGRVWFCGQGGAYLAYLEPETGDFTRFELADKASPHNLIIDARDQIWFAANTLPYIGRLDPETGEIDKFPMPVDAVKDPHTLVFDSAGDIWFTAQWSNHVGRLSVESGAVEVVAVPVERARPYGIKVDADDRPWIVLFGTNKLATVDPQTLQLKTIDLPRDEARPRRLEITADGMIWYGDYVGGMLGRYDPNDGAVTEWALPGGKNARPYGSALDDKGIIWLAEGGTPNRLAAFDTATETFVGVTEIPNSAGSIRHMYFHPASREIWFGEDSNFVGRVRLPRSQASD